MKHFWNDEAGFVISAELVLVSTILVIGLVVGLAEVQSAVVQELNDVGEAVGRLNQSYYYSGFAGYKRFGGFGGFGGGRFKAYTPGSAFFDHADSCDYNECALGCAGATGEYGAGWCGGTIGGGSIGGGGAVGSSNSCAVSCAIGK